MRLFTVDACPQTLPALGDPGKETSRALRAFQAEHQLKAHGVAGPMTLAALEKAEKPAPLRPVRATAAELRAKGSTTIKHADVLQKAATAAAVAGALKGTADSGALTFIEQATSAISQVKMIVTPFIEALNWLSSSVWIMLIGGGLLTWLYAGRIIRARVADHVSGKHIGR